MGKTSKWLRQLLKKKSKREKDGGNNNHNNSSSCSTTTTPKEKKRWSFRRSSTSSSSSSSTCKQLQFNNYASTTSASPIISIEEAATIKIQSVFRSYLARKALGALRGIVKLQALVRGQLVRKQAMATLRCMKALLRAQDRACAHRIRINSNQTHPTTHPNITHHCLLTHIYTEMEREVEEKMKKIVEMDECESKYKSSRSRKSKREKRHEYPSSQSTNTSSYSYSKQEINNLNLNHKVSVSSSAQSSPACKIDDSHHHNYSSLLPNYMSNTESSRAKFRSHSAPKQRPPQYWLERQSSRGKTTKPIINKTMQRSSSHVGVSTVTPHNYHYYPCSIVNLDASTVSLVHSECGSTSTLLTNAYHHPHEDRFW